MATLAIHALSLGAALKEEGFALPDDCYDIEIHAGADEALYIEYRCFVTPDKAALIGRALLRVAETHNEPGIVRRVLDLKKQADEKGIPFTDRVLLIGKKETKEIEAAHGRWLSTGEQFYGFHVVLDPSESMLSMRDLDGDAGSVEHP